MFSDYNVLLPQSILVFFLFFSPAFTAYDAIVIRNRLFPPLFSVFNEREKVRVARVCVCVGKGSKDAGRSINTIVISMAALIAPRLPLFYGRFNKTAESLHDFVT